MRPIEEQGYVVVAQDTETVSYVALARRLAQSLKQWHPHARLCLLTDRAVDAPEFDHVRFFTDPDPRAWHNDWQVWRHSPFRETIKLEADMLIASPIDHWWTMLRCRDLVISTGCRNWKDEISTIDHYRGVFRDNHLPDVYNAITYWRVSETARDFFAWVRRIFQDWTQYRRLLKFSPDQPDTDLVYAMAAQIMGPELVTVPGSPTIVHMKRHHAGTAKEPWYHELVWETNPLRIQTIPQWGAFHYHVKDWQP